MLKRLQYWIEQAQVDESKLLEQLMKSGDRQHAMEMNRMKKELAQAEKRLAEIDNLFSKLYEDRAKGKVSERNFLMLTNKYQDEQKSMEEKIAEYQERIKQTAQGKEHAEKWISLIRKYTPLTELTAPLLNELIEKIVVHEATKDENGNRTQKIDIYYRFIGKIDG